MTASVGIHLRHCRIAYGRLRATKQSRVTTRQARLRPCIDIHKGKVKQIVGSTLKDAKKDGNSSEQLVTNFVSDKTAEWYARLYKEDDLIGGHVIMLGQDEASKAAALSAVQAWPGGMHVGGGITTENAELFLEAGASHIIVTSYVFNNGRLDSDRLKALVKKVGAGRIVLDLSCRMKDGKYWVVTDRWQKFSELSVDAATLQLLSESCAEFLVHGVDVEGKQCGIDEDLITLLGSASPLPVTYAGGVKDLDDLERVSTAGEGRVDVTVGSALDIFGGPLAYADVVQWHRRKT